MQVYKSRQPSDCRVRTKAAHSCCALPIRDISGGKLKICFQFRKRLKPERRSSKRGRDGEGGTGRCRESGTEGQRERAKQTQSKSGLEKLLIVFPWCFEQGSGLKVSEQKAVEVPIVLATEPDPLAHTCTQTRARRTSFRSWHQQGGMQSWSGCGGGGVIGIRGH